MAEDNKNLQNTLDESKRLWGLVQQYAKLEMVDKLTFILTILIVGGVLVGLCTIAIFCFSMFFVTKLEHVTVSLALSYAIVGLCLLVLAVIVLLLRKSLVTRPIISSLMKEFFEKQDFSEDVKRK